jgi:hypothetical protein
MHTTIKTLFILLMSALGAMAQPCMRYSIALQQRQSMAAVQQWGTIKRHMVLKRDGHLYTRFRFTDAVLVSGDSLVAALDAPGGTLGDESERVSGLYMPEEGTTGLWMLERWNGAWRLVADRQGLLLWDGNLLCDGLTTARPKASTWRDSLGMGFIPESAHPKSSAPNITGIQPNTAHAGNGEIVSILGNGFGNAQGNGTVSFRNADDGGQTFVAAPADAYLSWSNNEIKIKIPTGAGTGPVQVSQIGTATSSAVLTIPWARQQVEHNNQNFSNTLIDANQSGGYLMKISDSFAADSARLHRFLEALVQWRCTSYGNITEASTTSFNSTKRDGINLVRLANAGELPAGVLGITYSYFSSCTASKWYTSELDMTFRDTALWSYNPSAAVAGKWDYYSVALHELGHALQLTHVINPNQLMHFSLSKGVRKGTLDSDAVLGVREILSESTLPTTCGSPAHRTLNADVCNDAAFGFFEPGKLLLFPNPGSGTCTLTYFFPEPTITEVALYSSTGNKIWASEPAAASAGINQTTLDPNRLGISFGLYYVVLNSGLGRFTAKWILTR